MGQAWLAGRPLRHCTEGILKKRSGEDRQATAVRPPGDLFQEHCHQVQAVPVWSLETK